MEKLLTVVCLGVLWLEGINGHAAMVDPESRNVIDNANYNGAGAPGYVMCPTASSPNYTPQGMFCGGRPVQEGNGGKCGACGDNYALGYPRPHDLGGTYAIEITPKRVYLEGQEITVKVKVTAAHYGYVKFKLCPYLESDYSGQDKLTECYDEVTGDFTVLPSPNGEVEFTGVNQGGDYYYDLILPAGFTCPYGCNMQYWYVTGNSPGSFPEHFVNCADIMIVNCDQWNSGQHADYCGLGPTSEMDWCGNGYTGGDDGGNDNGGNDNGGDNYGGNGGGDNYGGNGGGDNYGGNGGGAGNGGTGSGSGDNCTAEGWPVGSCAACTNAQDETCDNDCCSEGTRDVFVSVITGAPDMWCQEHCTMCPPFCPSHWCYKTQATIWVDVCDNTKKSLKSILERVEEKENKLGLTKNKKKKGRK